MQPIKEEKIYEWIHTFYEYCQKEAQNLGFETKLTKKGNLQIFVDGQDDYTIGFCAHVDTLGLMVRSIKDDGTLAFTNVGC